MSHLDALVNMGGARIAVGDTSLAAMVGVVILAAQLLKGLASRLGDEEGGEATEKHEEGVDLEDMVHPGSLVVSSGTASAQDGDGALADDGADLAGGGRDTVRGGTVSSREDFTRDNEGGSVGAYDRLIRIQKCMTKGSYRS